MILVSVKVKIIQDKYRIVDDNDKIAVSKNGKPLDGGGHEQIDKAIRQAGRINVATNFAPTKDEAG